MRDRQGGAAKPAPLDHAHARQFDRGAVAANIRAPVGEDGRLVRCAVWRVSGHRIDALRDRGQLGERAHQNAAALLACWTASGLAGEISQDFAPRIGTAAPASARHRAAEDDWHVAMGRLGAWAGPVAALICNEVHPGWRMREVRVALECLDDLAAKYDGMAWADEG
jgi:hypothetical protein